MLDWADRTGHWHTSVHSLEVLLCKQVAGERMPEHQKQNSYLGYKKDPLIAVQLLPSVGLMQVESMQLLDSIECWAVFGASQGPAGQGLVQSTKHAHEVCRAWLSLPL